MLDSHATPSRNKRVASMGSAAEFHASLGPGSVARKRSRGGGHAQQADVVLVSSDGHRFPFSSRALSASSPIWDTLLPSSSSFPTSDIPGRASPSPSLSGTTPAPADLPEVHLPESAACLAFVLRFLEHAPVGGMREVEFPRDWEVVRALDRYSIWRGVDAFTTAFSNSPLPPTLLPPAFAFSQLFDLPALARDVALQVAKCVSADADAVRKLVEGLEEARREWGVEGEGVQKLLSWLLLRSTSLHTLRHRALHALKSFDDPYDCEHSCRGLVYAQLVAVLTTTSRKKARKVDEEVKFECKDCDVRWDRVVEEVRDGLGELPECPFGKEEEGEGDKENATMAPLDPSVLLSTRLLRLNAALIGLVDPIEGASAAALQPLALELTRLVDLNKVFIPADAHQLLSSAINSLSSTSLFVPYTSLLTANARLAAAIELLATASPPPAVSRLPTELLAHIVHLLQDERDGHLRQRTNAILARTTRGLNRLVRPILKEEIVVGNSRQLEWFQRELQRPKLLRPRATRIYLEFKLDEIKRRANGAWAGRHLIPMLLDVADFSQLEVLSVELVQGIGGGPVPWTPRGYFREIEVALGIDEEGWWRVTQSDPDFTFPNVPDLTLPNAASATTTVGAVDALFEPPAKLRRLRIGCDSPPALFLPSAFRTNRLDYERLVQTGEATPGFRYEVLAIPYHTFYPFDFLPLIEPIAPSTQPTIHHLEVAFRIRNVQEDSAHIAKMLTSLSPSLRRLALRIKMTDAQEADIDAFSAAVRPALERCTRLEHLELYGALIDGRVVEATPTLTRLHTLGVLPSDGDIDEFGIAHAVGPRVRCQPLRLVLCRPPSWEEWALRYTADWCEDHDIELKIVERPDETAWLACLEE
ncbi:hypothetical protein JCM6882_008859 [Rhodosporidiobolus microsporus]